MARPQVADKGKASSMEGSSEYEGESKIIRNIDTCCAVGYTAG
jgi:hypothetical protein